MRVLVPPATATAGVTLDLDDAESHHLRVRRARAGQEAELRDGQGLDGTGILEPAGNRWTVRVTRAETVHPPAGLTLAVGAGDRERFGWLVEKAAELGVSRVMPLETSRTEGVATRIRERHVERLARRALEATKQSGAHWSPAVSAPEAYAAFIVRARSGARWLADGEGRAPETPAGEVTVLVGPEGGFTDEEREAAISAGWTPVALGPNVLRFETAAIAAAAHIAIERGRSR
ncbi:MAG TPA: RsmE family RNA methyltransferase [Gemmatimonadales bacterium]|nr:RsmE family RNA methyltransferase [Gemmatimonadales bacterium]